MSTSKPFSTPSSSSLIAADDENDQSQEILLNSDTATIEDEHEATTATINNIAVAPSTLQSTIHRSPSLPYSQHRVQQSLTFVSSSQPVLSTTSSLLSS
jgi:hypothetical protein